jgi:RNA recognition motif-containing protein
MRVYIGNLPKQCDAQSLEEYLGKIMVEFGGIIEAGSPITRTHLLTEELAGSALMEFRSVEETDAALQLTGLVFRGKVLEIRRPAQYYSYNLECLIKRAAPRINLAKVGLVPTYFDDQVSPASNKVFIGGLPLSMTADEV